MRRREPAEFIFRAATMKMEAVGSSIIKTRGTTTKIHDITHNGMQMADSLTRHGQSR